MIFKLISFTLALVLLFNSGLFRIAYAEAAGFNDVPGEWTSNARISRNGLGTTRQDLTQGLQNVQRGGGWVKADVTATVVAPLPFNTEWTTTQGLIQVALNGAFCVFPDPDDTGRFACFSSPVPGGTNTDPIKAGNVWTWEEPDLDVILTVRVDGIHFNYILHNSNAPTSNDVTITLGGGGTKFLGNSIVRPPGNTVIMSLPPGQAEDSSGDDVETDNKFVDVQYVRNGSVLTASIDDTGLTYPINIDPSINLDIGAGADDGRRDDTSWSTSGTTANVMGLGSSGEIREGYYRWPGITGIAQGDTVDAAYFNVPTRSGELSPALGKISLEDAGAPTQITSVADYTGRTRTTANQDYDDYTHVANCEYIGGDASRENIIIKTEVAELVADYTITAVSVLMDDDGTVSNADYMRFRSYDQGCSSQPNLVIEYTAAGGGGGGTFWFFYLSLVSQVAARWT